MSPLLLLTVVAVSVQVLVEAVACQQQESEEQVSVTVKRNVEKGVSDCNIGRSVIDLPCSLRLLLLAGVISHRGRTCTAPALLVPPSPPAAARTALAVWAQPTAGTYQVAHPQFYKAVHDCFHL